MDSLTMATIHRSRGRAWARLAYVVAACPLLVQVGCATQGGDRAGESLAADGRERVAAEARVAIPTQPPEPDGEHADGSTAGELDGDGDLDGGCLWIVEGDGTAVSVRWPPGWSAAFDPPRLLDESGHVVAGQGEEVVLAGGFSPALPGLMDRCLVNPDLAFDAHNARPPIEGLDEP